VSLKDTLKGIEKDFGAGAVFRGNDSGLDIEVIPTGIVTLDNALGAGGLPRGRVVEIFGQPSSAKTTLSLTLIATAQAMGENCVFIDVEHALDPSYAKNIGVNTDELIIAQPDSAEQALELCERFILSGDVGVVVVDSVAALVPRAEIAGDYGDTHIGLQARLMSQAMRKMTGALSSSPTVCVFINQIREKVGVIFGSPEITSGGRALKFYASVRIETRRGKAIKDGDNFVGTVIKANVVKNKVGPPFRKVEMELFYGEDGLPIGLSREGALIEECVSRGLVVKSGAWYAVTESGERMGQGITKACRWLSDHPNEFTFLMEKAGDGTTAREANSHGKV